MFGYTFQIIAMMYPINTGILVTNYVSSCLNVTPRVYNGLHVFTLSSLCPYTLNDYLGNRPILFQMMCGIADKVCT